MFTKKLRQRIKASKLKKNDTDELIYKSPPNPLAKLVRLAPPSWSTLTDPEALPSELKV